LQTFFGITKRLYYFFALIFVLIAVYTAGIKIYKWYQLSPETGWVVTSDCNVQAKKICLVVKNKEEKVFVEVNESFDSLSLKDKTKTVDEIKINVFGDNKLTDQDFYWSLFFIVAIFPIFRLGHVVVRWIIWGRIK
jgi:hypothetical protein